MDRTVRGAHSLVKVAAYVWNIRRREAAFHRLLFIARIYHDGIQRGC